MNSVAYGSGYYRFLRFGHILGAALREILEERFLEELSEYALNRAQFCSLKLIAHNADLKVGDLAKFFGTSSAACTKNVEKLVDLGLISRTVSEEDRRATLLSPNQTGRRLVEEYEDLKWRRVAPAIEQLGPEKAEQLCDLLEQVCLSLLEHENPPRGPCMRCAGYFQADCSVARIQGNCSLKFRQRSQARLAVAKRRTGGRRTVGTRLVQKGTER